MTRIFIFISAFVSMSLLTLIYGQVAQQPTGHGSAAPSAMASMPGMDHSGSANGASPSAALSFPTYRGSGSRRSTPS